MRQQVSRTARYDVDRSATMLLPDVPIPVQAVLHAVIAYGVGALINKVAPGSVAAIPLAMGVTSLFLMGQEKPQLALGGGSMTNRVPLRALLALVAFGISLNAASVGFLLPLCGVPLAAVHLQWSGSKAWKPLLRTVLAASVVNQLVLMTGVLPCVLNPVTGGVAALFGLLITAGAVANIGLTIERREEVLSRLTNAEARFRALVQNSSDVVTVAGADGVLTYVSPACEPVLQIPHDRLMGYPVQNLVIEEDITEFQEHLASVMAQDAPGEGAAPEAAHWEARLRHVGEGTRWLEFSAINQLHDPVVGGIVMHVREITQRRTFQDQLAFAATHDPLTGLSTRDDFLRGAQSLIAGARPDAWVALMFCDLDRFKAVNDTLGHGAGDEVLTQTARRLRAGLRSADLLGRMGGDEFTLCLANLPDATVAQRIAGDLKDAVAAPFTLSNGAVATIGVSIGVCVVSDGARDAEDLLREADHMMYTLKHQTPDAPRVPQPRSRQAARNPAAGLTG